MRPMLTGRSPALADCSIWTLALMVGIDTAATRKAHRLQRDHVSNSKLRARDGVACRARRALWT